MPQAIHISPIDNVVVALHPIAKGTLVEVDGLAVTALEDIPQGHKMAVKPIKNGENVIKYGFPIGHATADAAPGTPTASLPSWQQMRALAESDGPTAALLRQEAVDHAMEGFDPLPEEETDSDKWQEKLTRTQKGALACTIQNAWVILEHDPALKGRIWVDTFAERLRCKGPFPWSDKQQERDWSDEDDAGIRWYLETIYHFSGVNKAADAVALTGDKHRKDPVRE